MTDDTIYQAAAWTHGISTICCYIIKEGWRSTPAQRSGKEILLGVLILHGLWLVASIPILNYWNPNGTLKFGEWLLLASPAFGFFATISIPARTQWPRWAGVLLRIIIHTVLTVIFGILGIILLFASVPRHVGG